jgi:hypothetical protein
MLVLAASIAAVATALSVVLFHLRRAPLGYEDETGFHIVQHVRGSAIRRHQRAKGRVAGALKGARAHS